MRKKIVLALAASWLLILSSPANAFDIIQITDNDIDDFAPSISGSTVVWGRYGEVYLWDGNFPIVDHTLNVTGSDWPCEGPRIDGSHVVWNYHGTTPDYLDDVYFWDGQFPITDHTTRITNDFDVDWYPDVSGSNVVWACKADLCLWDGTTTTLITTSDEGYVLSPARISGSNVVWECRDGNDSEICFWDGTFPIEIVQITNNETLDFAPAISGSNVVWHGDDGSDYEIYLWDGFTTTNISNNGTADFAPAISGSNVVWQCSGDICFWDGTFPIVPIQIGTGGGYLEISGSNVVWSGSDGNDQEIYMTYVPEPIFPLLMGSGLLGLAALNQRRKRKGI